ncbi:MAG TPA: protein phosphatase 2C domain-containing protein, partial [Phototrophicaceae bacterium]|nr:protein phosphatase 2C domain-containing protein [Phototrophicaceae bacterium]
MDLFRRLFGKSEEELNAMGIEENTKPLPGPLPTSPSETDPVTEPGVPVIDPMNPSAATAPLTPPPARPGQTTPLPMIPDGTTRPLQPEKAISNNNEHITFGQSSDVGLVRSNNQDSAFSFFATNRSVEERPDFGLFIVADGMGGHHDGEKASAITARVVAAQITSQVYMPLLNLVNDPDRPTIIESLIAAVQRANAEVMIGVPEGGTTITAVAVVGDLAHFAHVGDSRAYLVTQDGVEQVTRDHSLVQRLIELGQLTPEEAADHPQKNVLYRAIGQSETLEVDTLTRRLPPNSR